MTRDRGTDLERQRLRRILERSTSPHTVYVVRAADGEVVYIGCTGDFDQRRKGLRRCEWWGTGYTIVELAVFVSKQDALAYELAYIKAVRPRFNKQGNPDVPHWRSNGEAA